MCSVRLAFLSTPFRVLAIRFIGSFFVAILIAAAFTPLMQWPSTQ